jgi:cell division protease FtsH
MAALDQRDSGRNRPPQFDWRWLLLHIVLAIWMIWIWQQVFSRGMVQTIPYSDFKKHLVAGEVKEAGIATDEITGRIEPRPPQPTDGAAPSEAKPFIFRTVRVEDQSLVNELQQAGVTYGGIKPSVLSQFLTSWLIPIAIMMLFWFGLSRLAGATGHAIMGIGRSRARLIIDEKTGVSFEDVAGCDEAKYELQEVVDFLKNPKRYQALGARIPKGALLVGPPGTGKTLLARAVAGEAKVPFFSLSGSDFVEMFVGVGAARVRDLFQQAKNRARCIIFIDELDAIGRQRGVHVGVGHDEREQTLNQLLVEMDGFDANAGVILLAATNRPEVLDRALLRPGRFDRQIIVDAPDLDGREAILKVHARGKRLSADVDLREIARATPGFSGADLANALNEAALHAARRNASEIHQQDVREALEKVIAGPERKSRRLSEDDKRRVAYHEVGHALVAAYSEHADPVRKISIVPRGRAALGYTMQLPTQQQFLMTRAEILDRIRGLLGGRAAEELIFGEVTTGAENDLERATAMARQMVGIYGMSENIGLARVLQREASAFLTGANGALQRDCSDETAERVDAEVKAILDNAYADAKRTVSEQRDQLENVTRELLKHESLDGDAFYQLIGRSPLDTTPRSPHKQPDLSACSTSPRVAAEFRPV